MKKNWINDIGWSFRNYEKRNRIMQFEKKNE